MFYSVTIPKKRVKVETIAWTEFFQTEQIPSVIVPKKSIAQQLVSSSIMFAGAPQIRNLQDGSIAVSSDMSTKISHSFDPLIHVIQGFSHPLAFIMISSGCIMLMMNQKSKGMQIIKWAAVGYIAIWFVPTIMNILEGVGRGIESGS